MAGSDQQFYERMIRRITWVILALGIAGALVLSAVKGFRIGLAFLLGASASYASFWRWQRVLSGISPGPAPQSSWRLTVRMLLWILIACVIIKLLGLSVATAVTGLLVSAAAVIVEIIYQLIYANA